MDLNRLNQILKEKDTNYEKFKANGYGYFEEAVPLLLEALVKTQPYPEKFDAFGDEKPEIPAKPEKLPEPEKPKKKKSLWK